MTSMPKLALPPQRRFSLWRRFARADGGVTAVEFAFVAPVFLYALATIIETGLMLFAEYVLQTSVQDAARLVRTGQAQTAAMNAAAFKAAICDTANIVIDCTGSVTVYLNKAGTFTALKALVPSPIAVGPTYGGGGPAAAAAYDCGLPNDAIALIATYDWDFTFPLFNLFGNVEGGMAMFGNVNGGQSRRLAGIAMFRNEPFPAGIRCG